MGHDPNQRSSQFSTELLHRKVAFQQRGQGEAASNQAAAATNPERALRNQLSSPLGTALFQKKMQRQRAEGAQPSIEEGGPGPAIGEGTLYVPHGLREEGGAEGGGLRIGIPGSQTSLDGLGGSSTSLASAEGDVAMGVDGASSPFSTELLNRRVANQQNRGYGGGEGAEPSSPAATDMLQFSFRTP